MFKEPLSNVKTLASLRNSDRRKLKQRIIQAYGISPELSDLLVPNGLMSQQITTCTGTRGVVYLSPDGDPLWFMVGRSSGDLVPTVYTLWKKYDLLPWVSTPGAVIPLLVGGADLTIPSVVQVSNLAVSQKQLVGILRHADSTSTLGPPLAVGRLAVDLDTLKRGAKGAAVRVLHTWKDHLFEMGRQDHPPGEIKIEKNERGSEYKLTTEPVGAHEGRARAPNDLGGKNATASNPLPPDASTTPTVIPKVSASAQRNPTFSKEGETYPPRQHTSVETLVEISDMLRIAVLQAIKTSLSSLVPGNFPLRASVFYSSYILPYRPAFVHKSLSDENSQSPSPSSSYLPIDIKHSSYKSLLAFLKALEKQRILVLKETRPEALVLYVSTTHPDVLAHQLYTSLRDVRANEDKRVRREEEERSRVRELEVKKMWKPHSASGSARFFSEGRFDSSALYSYSDLRSAVNKYASARRLVSLQDQSYINVGKDRVLFSTVHGRGEAPESVKFLKREEVVRRISRKMQSWYEVRGEGKDPILKEGQLKPISVVVKVRRGKKFNTLVTGFEPFFVKGEEMADKLRRPCASATSVSSVRGRASGLEVMVQGKQIRTVTEFLLSKGVPRKFIKFTRKKFDRYVHNV